MKKSAFFGNITEQYLEELRSQQTAGNLFYRDFMNKVTPEVLSQLLTISISQTAYAMDPELALRSAIEQLVDTFLKKFPLRHQIYRFRFGTLDVRQLEFSSTTKLSLEVVPLTTKIGHSYLDDFRNMFASRRETYSWLRFGNVCRQSTQRVLDHFVIPSDVVTKTDVDALTSFGPKTFWTSALAANTTDAHLVFGFPMRLGFDASKTRHSETPKFFRDQFTKAIHFNRLSSCLVPLFAACFLHQQKQSDVQPLIAGFGSALVAEAEQLQFPPQQQLLTHYVAIYFAKAATTTFAGRVNHLMEPEAQFVGLAGTEMRQAVCPGRIIELPADVCTIESEVIQIVKPVKIKDILSDLDEEI